MRCPHPLQPFSCFPGCEAANVGFYDYVQGKLEQIRSQLGWEYDKYFHGLLSLSN